MGFLFSLAIGIIEKLFASELEKYLEAYHRKRVAENIADAPVTKDELLTSFSG